MITPPHHQTWSSFNGHNGLRHSSLVGPQAQAQSQAQPQALAQAQAQPQAQANAQAGLIRR
jgi:hypothetical protein